MKNERAEVNGVTLSGPPVAGGRSPAILLHDWMGRRTFWKETIQAIAAERTVLALDFRGHGNSGTPQDGYTIEQLAADVVGLMDQLQIDRATIIGHSMGGMVAQQLAVSYAPRVSGLGLVTTIAVDSQNQLISKRIAADAKRLGFRAAFGQHFSQWIGQKGGLATMAWVRREMLRTSETVALALVESYSGFDLREHLPSVSALTLVVAATADVSAIPSESELLAQLIPQARLMTIDGCGHFPMLEAPAELNRLIARFLKHVA